MPVIDASVWVARFLESDEFHVRAKKFFEQLVESEGDLRIPAIAFAEVGGTIRRMTGSTVLTNKVIKAMRDLDPDVWDIDGQMASLGSQLASSLALRGCDSFYVAVARESGDVLVTLDRQQLERGSAEVEAREP